MHSYCTAAFHQAADSCLTGNDEKNEVVSISFVSQSPGGFKQPADVSFNFSHCLHVQQLSVRRLERGIYALLMCTLFHLVINGKPSSQPFVHFDLH